MLNVKSRKLVLTLFCSLALVLVLTDGVSANSQLDGHRMLRKRAIGDVIDAGTKDQGGDPDQGHAGGLSNSLSASSSSLPPSSSSSLPHSSPSAISLTPSSSGSSSSSLSVSSSSSSSSSTSSTSVSTPPPSTPTPQNNDPAPSPTSTTSQGQKTEFRTVTSSDSSSTSTAPPVTSGATATTKTTLTVIIALAASIGAVAIIWTLIRKWKFKPSDKFEDRMQPIDWQPAGPEEAVPGLHRATSTHSHASFYSGGHESDHTSSQQHGNNTRRDVPPLPEHDFTAGPAHLAPVGGYADLARGPSPQPQVSQMHEAQYGVPLHHQGAYDSYGTVNGQRY